MEKINSISKPYMVSLDITNKCNLSCLHCYNRSGNDLYRNELSDDEVIDVIHQVGKLKPYSFCFCGGETFIRFELMLEGIRILKSYGVAQVNLVTNGMLVTHEKINQLIQAGITSVQVSLDGSCEKSHNKMRGNRAAFRNAIHAIELFNESKVPIAVSFCPTNFNYNEFVEVAELLSKFEYMHELRSQPLMVIGRATNQIEPSEAQYRELVENILLLKKSKKYKFNIEWGDPVDHIIRYSMGLIKNISLTIHSNGDIVLSPYVPIVLGNVKNHDLDEYYKAGLLDAWSITNFKEYLSEIRSLHDLGKPFLGRVVYQNDPLKFDLIDDLEVLF